MALDIVGSNPNRVHFENSAPILRVENMQTSLHFYGKLLGFTCSDWGNDEFTCVSRDSAANLSLPRRPGSRWCLGLDWGRRCGETPRRMQSQRTKNQDGPYKLPLGSGIPCPRSRPQRSPLRLRAPCRTTDALVEKPAVTDRMYSTLTI